MAKSVRASVQKRNRAKLRATVFGPVVDARTERLSAKLQELASQPKPSNEEKPDMELNMKDRQEGTKISQTSEDMDIDNGTIKTTQGRSHKGGRIHKRHSNRKNRSSIVFRPHQSKNKKGLKRRLAFGRHAGVPSNSGEIFLPPSRGQLRLESPPSLCSLCCSVVQEAFYRMTDEPPQTEGGIPPFEVDTICLIFSVTLTVYQTRTCQLGYGICQHNLLEIAPACGRSHREIAMKVARSKWTILIANILVPISILVFSSGFFPYKTLLTGFATHEHTIGGQIPPGVFDKVLLLQADFHASDFVYSQHSGFLFTQRLGGGFLIRSGAALPFTAYASAPTVTMPRLKAITTGSVPSFLDVILNIAEADTSSTLMHQDTWLAQLKAKGGKLVMYGDDTWLKLFPGMFHRADGTTSFFVSDFTEVDNNVTRHIPNELLQDDWSAFIMHYLGLDHIGHKAGPNSPYMITKQHEMDSVVSMVYTALEQEKHLKTTLFVLCGDHGMNEAGNHGGSSVGETSPALLFISPKFQRLETRNDSPTEEFSDLQYYHTVEQTDITPTLAGLLGLPIPLNSLGVFIPELLAMWDHGAKSIPLTSSSGPHRIHMLLENAKQLLGAVKGSFPSYSFEFDLMPVICSSQSLIDIERVQCAWFRVLETLNGSGANHDSEASSEIESALLLFLRNAQKLMSSAASDYDLIRLYVGLSISGFAISLTFFPAKRLLVNFAPAGMFLGFSILSYSTMMFASSYVEEEQQFWYWISMGWVVYLHVKYAGHFHGNSIQKSGPANGHWPFEPSLPWFGAAALAVSYRVLRRWNQTGQKFAAQPDITGSFFPSHQHTLWALLSLAASDSPELLGNSFLQPVAMLTDGMHLLYHARMVLCGISLLMIYSLYAGKARETTHKGRGKWPPSTIFHETLTLFLLMQSKVTNIPAFLVFRVQITILASMRLSTVEQTITSLLMQYVTFYAFGGSNAISSVDISNAYNGIGTYSVFIVGALTFISNWAAPIWWVSASRLLRSSQNREEKEAHVTILTLYMATILMSVMAACTTLRTHLFIWTVFSPKYLYTIAWAMINHIVVNVLGEIDWRLFMKR
ncbi:GPI ethanolamine phosphate transferase 2 [Aspergillus flavus AF70]|nr:GPI ethanolamine phosphate transferase 2 [Aspergillus flavus AF70]